VSGRTGERVSARAVVLALVVACLSGSGGSAQSTVALTPGMVITRSMTIRPGSYILPASADLKTPAITIRGENITVAFNGATLAGTREGPDPDSYAGVGILIDGGSKVTVKNAIIRRYKVGILARKSADLHLTRNDVSHNWKQRLYSGIEKESLVDWMSYHQNEQDEWLLRWRRDRHPVVAERLAGSELGLPEAPRYAEPRLSHLLERVPQHRAGLQPHESKVDRARIAGGARRFKVQYYEVGGFAELRFDIQRR
jgi:hypothetical protein